MDAEFWRNKNEVDNRKKYYANKYSEQSREKLKEIVIKYMKTIMIGALHDMEQNLGVVWGHGKDESELTDNQKKGRKMWEAARESVLDRGNLKIAHFISEISRYDVTWNKYYNKFDVRKDHE